MWQLLLFSNTLTDIVGCFFKSVRILDNFIASLFVPVNRPTFICRTNNDWTHSCSGLIYIIMLTLSNEHTPFTTQILNKLHLDPHAGIYFTLHLDSPISINLVLDKLMVILDTLPLPPTPILNAHTLPLPTRIDYLKYIFFPCSYSSKYRSDTKAMTFQKTIDWPFPSIIDPILFE